MKPGEKVRELREEMNISVQDLAKAANMRPQYLMQLEEDAVPAVNTHTWQKLADALSVPLTVVMGEEEYDPKQSVFEEMTEGESVVMRLVVRMALLFGVLVIISLFLFAGVATFLAIQKLLYL